MSLTKSGTVFLAVLSALGAHGASLAESLAGTELTRGIPSRPAEAFTGSQFAEHISKFGSHERELAVLEELRKGNLPAFLRNLVPIQLSVKRLDNKPLTATIFVTPDYLAIGTDADFLRMPMNLHSALEIAKRFGFLLPTRKIVDAIYGESRFHFSPQPLPAGPRMTSTEYYRLHDQMIEQQFRSLGISLGALVSGHKKDLVITNRLVSRPSQLAIYGWHRSPGEPIQPLSTVHGAGYADYSHGIRLVSETAVVDGKLRSVHDILRDPVLARILSDEGPIAMPDR